MDNIKKCINDCELFDDSYMKNIYFLGIAYQKSNEFDYRRLFFKSHELIYCLQIDMDKIDTGFDAYISGGSARMLQFKNIEELHDFINKYKLEKFMCPNCNNKIIFEKTDGGIKCDFFTMYYFNTGIFSDIFVLDKSKLNECTFEEFNSKLLNEYSLEKILKFQKNTDTNITQEDNDYVL